MPREKSCRDGTGGREEVMKELRLVIVDDEELAIQNLEEQIEAINGPIELLEPPEMVCRLGNCCKKSSPMWRLSILKCQF